MKSLLLILGLAFTGQSLAADLIVALSPHHEPKTVRRQVQSLIEMMVHLPTSAEIVTINAETAQTIVHFRNPDLHAQRGLKRWMKSNRDAVSELMWFAQNAKRRGRSAGAINLPKIMRHISRYHADAKDLMILGSAVYDVPEQPALFMGGGLVPSDGYLMAAASKPFGTTKLSGAIQDMRVHWWLSHTLEEEGHAHAVERFYHLYFDRLGGQFVSFTPDMDTVIKRYRKNAAPLNMSYTLNEQARPEMLRIQKLENTNPPRNAPLSNSSASEEAPQSFTVGIQWTGPADLDLFAVSQTDGKVVYFNNTQTDKARHFKDIRSGGDAAQTFYETIEYQPVPLSGVVFAVNMFGGSSINTPLAGSIRLSVAGQVYAMPFEISATSGNQGEDVAQVLASGTNSIHTVRFTPTEIMQYSIEQAQETTL